MQVKTTCLAPASLLRHSDPRLAKFFPGEIYAQLLGLNSWNIDFIHLLQLLSLLIDMKYMNLTNSHRRRLGSEFGGTEIFFLTLQIFQWLFRREISILTLKISDGLLLIIVRLLTVSTAWNLILYPWRKTSISHHHLFYNTIQYNFVYCRRTFPHIP